MTVTTNDQSRALDLGQIVAFDNVDNVISAERRPAVFPGNLGALFFDSSCDFLSDLGKVLGITDCIVRELTENDIGGHLAPPGSSLWLLSQISSNSLATQFATAA